MCTHLSPSNNHQAGNIYIYMCIHEGGVSSGYNKSARYWLLLVLAIFISEKIVDMQPGLNIIEI